MGEALGADAMLIPRMGGCRASKMGVPVVARVKTLMTGVSGAS